MNAHYRDDERENGAIEKTNGDCRAMQKITAVTIDRKNGDYRKRENGDYRENSERSLRRVQR